MSYMNKLKKLINTGDSTYIQQALQIAEDLPDIGSKGMKELMEFLEDFLEDKSYDVLDNNRGNRVNTNNPAFELSVPVWTEVSLAYRDGEIIAEISLVEDWSDRDIALTKWGERIKVTRAYERIIEKEFRVLPISEKIVVDDFSNLDVEADYVRDSLVRKLKKPVQRAADKIEKRLNR